MILSIDELETIKKSFQEGYAQGMDYSDSCLAARIKELEEELDKLKADLGVKKNEID